MANASRPAGGRATASGMTFQAGVGAWFAAHLATATPLGTRFGLSATALPKRLQFETARFLDDIQMDLSDGSSIFVQCKTRPTLSSRPDSPFAGTIAQLAELILIQRGEGAGPDTAKTAAVLAVAADASRSLDDLEAACRYFDLGATWADAQNSVSMRQAAALKVLADTARDAWKSLKAGEPSEDDLASLARLLHVVRFDVENDGADRREAARLIGVGLLGNEGAGAAALASFQQTVNHMTRSGAPADRLGLMQRLRAAGFVDIRSPGYDDDLQRLAAKTESEIQRLLRHTRLRTSPETPIPRRCMAALAEAIDAGSLLVIGEPGAGKTGVLVSHAECLSQAAAPLVLLSVDSLSGVIGRDMLRTELQLEHDLLDVLAAWPGRDPGVFIIDALDASRGGPSEQVFANLIEEGLRRLGERWSIVASIRTFDLKSGTRFRSIMAGQPPSASYSDPDLPNVRHILIPRLDSEEMGALAQTDRQLSRLFDSAPSSLQELLRNVFNLSLAADLISGGATAESIATATTQSDLIWRYEDARIGNDRLRNAVGDTLSAMIDKRRITVLRSRIRNDAVGEVVQSGVLALAGERVSFSHHVLFDHAASRYYLEWDDMDALALQVSSDPSIGLLLGPALRFAVEKAWREDDLGHAKTWRLISKLCANADVDPVVSSVALRTAAEGVAGPEDVAGLLELLRANVAPRELAVALDRLARFVGMCAAGPNGLSASAAIAWTAVARQGADNLYAEYSDGVRFLLMTLAERGEFSNTEFAGAFGEAARKLLTFAWSRERDIQGLAIPAIRFVTASYASDVDASRELLSQILGDQRFEHHAHEETPWLAEGVSTIAPVDPEFALYIYRAIFGRDIGQDGRSWLGGRPSRILPMSSTWKQDYQQARWRLKESYPTLLAASPRWGTKVANAVAIGTAMLNRAGLTSDPIRIPLPAGRELGVVEDHQLLIDWRSERHPDNHEEVLGAFAAYLRKCGEAEFRSVVDTALQENSAGSVWSRILGVGAERVDVAGDVLWCVASSLPLIELRDVSRDAIIFIAAAYALRVKAERSAFETALLDWLSEKSEKGSWRLSLATRILSTVPDEALVTDEIRELKAGLEVAGKLAGNHPYVTITVGRVEDDTILGELIPDEGSDQSVSSNRAVRNSPEELEALTSQMTGECDAEQIATLWEIVSKVVAIPHDAGDAAIHAELSQANWGAVARAVDMIAKGGAYAPEVTGHPSLAAITMLVDKLAVSPYPAPQPSEGDDSFIAWGNWDVRVYAASALIHLCRRFGALDPSLIDRLEVLAFDPVPTVRLQIAQSLNTLWDVARDRMWDLVTKVGSDEQHVGVLGFFVSGPLRRLSEPMPERVEAIVSGILERISRLTAERLQRDREPLAEAIAGLASRLWVGRNRPAAQVWIKDWTSDLVRNETYVWTLLSSIRMGLFETYVHPDDQTAAGIQKRSKELADRVVRTASRVMLDSLPKLQRADAASNTREMAENRYKVAARLLDHVMSQLYFGSGAFRRSDRDGKSEAPGLADGTAKRAFLRDYADTLDAIGQVGTAHTLHHLLELYGHLADAAPEAVFDRLVDLLVGPASREGYHFESLGSDALVRLVRRYLADHREVFEDPGRRARLVEVLELFSGAGWPEALKLLYELPDLLR